MQMSQLIDQVINRCWKTHTYTHSQQKKRADARDVLCKRLWALHLWLFLSGVKPLAALGLNLTTFLICCHFFPFHRLCEAAVVDDYISGFCSSLFNSAFLKVCCKRLLEIGQIGQTFCLGFWIGRNTRQLQGAEPALSGCGCVWHH